MKAAILGIVAILGVSSYPAMAETFYQLSTLFSQNIEGGSCLDITNSNDWPYVTTPIYQPCQNDSGQFWLFEPYKNGFKLKTLYTNPEGLCLDTDYENRFVSNGILVVPVSMKRCGDYTGQIWHETIMSNGYAKLTNTFTGSSMGLDVRYNTNLEVYVPVLEDVVGPDTGQSFIIKQQPY